MFQIVLDFAPLILAALLGAWLHSTNRVHPLLWGCVLIGWFVTWIFGPNEWAHRLVVPGWVNHWMVVLAASIPVGAVSTILAGYGIKYLDTIGRFLKAWALVAFTLFVLWTLLHWAFVLPELNFKGLQAALKYAIYPVRESERYIVWLLLYGFFPILMAAAWCAERRASS